MKLFFINTKQKIRTATASITHSHAILFLNTSRNIISIIIAGMAITTDDTLNIVFASPVSLPSFDEKKAMPISASTNIKSGVI